MTQEDSVRLRQQFIADYAPDGGDVEFTRRLSALIGARIDSLTAERDRLAAAGCPRCGHALRNEQDHALGSPCPMCGCMSTGGSDGAEAWRIRAEAAEAEVQRLAEAEAHALRAIAEAWAEEHYLHDSVGAFESGWEARQSVIDSLTAERDRALGTAMTFSKAATDVLARAEAAEADRERLREALRKVEVAHFGQWCALCLGAKAPALHKPDCPVGAALATPPSEGEQS